ncbi:MAG: ABC transporter ATP-binding protein [Candidatus Aminicenantaceae bacterium]
MEAAIHIRDLKKEFPVVKSYRELLFHPLRKNKVSALNGIDLDVPQGKCFCLLGPNGAGKTTLIKILSTLIIPNHGEACVNGYDVVKKAPQVKATIGCVVSEERSFYWRLTGRQNLEFFAYLNNIPRIKIRSRISEIIALTNLEKEIDFRFNTYSTGKRQMMAFARALLMDARTIFVDEPTRSLDPEACQRVQSFLKHELVERQKRTVFWATHNLSEAQEFGDEVAVIKEGRIRIKGSIQDLMQGEEKSLRDIYRQATQDDDH